MAYQDEMMQLAKARKEAYKHFAFAIEKKKYKKPT